MNKNRNFHSIEAAAGAANEVVSLGLVEENKVFSATPVARSPFNGTVIVPSLVHFKHIILILLVPKCCITIIISYCILLINASSIISTVMLILEREIERERI